MDNETLKDELSELSPRLREMKEHQEGRRTPENYFERMESEVFASLDSIGARRKPVAMPRPVQSWWQWLLQPRMALALGSMMMLLMAGWWLWGGYAARQQAPALAAIPEVSLTADDIEAYVADNLQEFEPEQLAAQLPEVVAPTEPTPTAPALNNAAPSPAELSPRELEQLLEDVSDEELEDIL
jgi:hypothetical protein